MSLEFLLHGRRLSMTNFVSGNEAKIRLISKKPLKRPDAVIQFTGSDNVIVKVGELSSAKNSSPGIDISVTEDYWLTYDIEKEMEEYEEDVMMHSYWDNQIIGGDDPIKPYRPLFTKESMFGLKHITVTVVAEDVTSKPDKFMQNIPPSTLKFEVVAYFPREGGGEFNATYTIGDSEPVMHIYNLGGFERRAYTAPKWDGLMRMVYLQWGDLIRMVYWQWGYLMRMAMGGGQYNE